MFLVAVVLSACEPPPDSLLLCQTTVSSAVGNSGSIYQPMPVWDLSTGKALRMELGVLMRVAGVPADGEPERGKPVLKGFEIGIDTQDLEPAAASANRWWIPAAGSLVSGKTTTGMVPVMPDWLAKKLAPKMSSAPSATGWPVIYLLIKAVISWGGRDVECAVAVLPVELCSGCL